MERILPDRITFQWHITDQCNLRCRHCYQESYASPGLPATELENLLGNMTDFVKACRQQRGNARARINITGGEPFLKEELFPLLDRIAGSGLFTFGILTNGFLPPPEKLKHLAELKPDYIQVSMEGERETNDLIRGEGSFDRTLEAVRTYRRYNIPVMISFTANALNHQKFPGVVRIARRLGAYKVWTDRYLPSSPDDPLQLSPEQTKAYFELLGREKRKFSLYAHTRTEVAANRSLQFLVAGGVPYSCSAGRSLLAVLPDGTVLPCRRLPINVGNALQESLVDIYMNNSVLRELDDPEKTDGACASCYYRQLCRGGLKCLSWALTGDFHRKDPGCPLNF
ncbi:MAG: radical SAM protein [Bacteroidota bacterium]